jgi:hypothetical protein
MIGSWSSKGVCMLQNPSSYVSDSSHPHYDKIGKVRWLMDKMRGKCNGLYNLGKFVTMDEMIVSLQGKILPDKAIFAK